MAITTLDGALAGFLPPISFANAVTGTMVAGRPCTTFYLAGYPGAAVAPSPGIGGAALTSYSGQLPFTNPSGGKYTYLGRLVAQATQAGNLWLCDRLWHNSDINITSNSEQTFTGSVDIPARDMNGLALGHGVYAAVEVSTTTGSGTPTLTLKYTNQDNTSGKTATNILATAATTIKGTFYPIDLAAGDSGIRKAESLTLSATWTSGTIHVVLYRVIAELPLLAGIPNSIDVLTSGFARLYDNTVPFLVFRPSTTTTSNIMGQLIYTQG